jgi:hypothetical protein
MMTDEAHSDYAQRVIAAQSPSVLQQVARLGLAGYKLRVERYGDTAAGYYHWYGESPSGHMFTNNVVLELVVNELWGHMKYAEAPGAE